ncbi:hypothetical protein ATO10_03300 [Actibacterium atlanticum]|uniref:SPOR domain-containing protein n=1 Tax=Actibacterium atlanticum TaxID=1461693 RepID=A0A058ZQB5_9RHOB|nr:SPOR domain-containing protein [Actibacterium atlanticum]KCV83754.1 hypothetical protein ATO10_03300 [Actibacterium atlanticum]
MADIDYDEYHTEPQAQPRSGAVQSMVTWAGALTSVGLVVGLAVWGVQLTMRDVSGVPVVQALEGPMRVAPVDPGGQQADHQGLAVNQVAAEGEAAEPADRLLLAPSPVDLATEDATPAALRPVPRVETAAAPATTPDTAPEPAPQSPIVAPEAVAAALALAQEISEGATPLSPPVEPVQTAAVAPAPAPAPAPVAVPKVSGLQSSPRPKPRPAVDLTASRPAPASVSTEVSATSVAPGTNLVQLGAFDSPEVARNEWQRLSVKFGSLLEGKQRLVQSAVSGGRTFYRLRAVGFTDLSDARRFCAALTAEKADCIPVVSR